MDSDHVRPLDRQFPVSKSWLILRAQSVYRIRFKNRPGFTIVLVSQWCWFHSGAGFAVVLASQWSWLHSGAGTSAGFGNARGKQWLGNSGSGFFETVSIFFRSIGC